MLEASGKGDETEKHQKIKRAERKKIKNLSALSPVRAEHCCKPSQLLALDGGG